MYGFFLFIHRAGSCGTICHRKEFGAKAGSLLSNLTYINGFLLIQQVISTRPKYFSPHLHGTTPEVWFSKPAVTYYLAGNSGTNIYHHLQNHSTQ